MLKTITKTIYKTTDGLEFMDELEATLHQTKLDATKQVNQFIDSLEMTDRGKSGLRTRLLEWEAFKAKLAFDAEAVKKAADDRGVVKSDGGKGVQQKAGGAK